MTDALKPGEICTVRLSDGAVVNIGGRPFISGITPVGWLVIDARGNRSLHLDHALAIQRAADGHGTIIGVVTQRIE